MLIFCGGMYRSGSTLQYNLISEIIECKKIGERIPYANYQLDVEGYLLSSTEDSSIGTMKIHDLPSSYSNIKNNLTIRSLTCHRDIRDVVASWQAKNKINLDPNDGISFARRVITSYQKWEELPKADCLVMTYDELTKNTLEASQRICNFINIDIEERALSKVCEMHSSENQKIKLQSLSESQITKYGKMRWDSHTLIHLDHFNGGKIGRAKDELEPKLFESISEEFGDWLIEHGYQV